MMFFNTRLRLAVLLVLAILVVTTCYVAYAITVTLHKANVVYEALPVANVEVYSTDVGVYGRIYSVYPHGDYLYAITTKGYLLRSSDGVHWQVLGNVLPDEYRKYVPHNYRGGIFVTSNGTVLVNFCNTTAGVYLLLRGTPDKFPFKVVMTGGCWWSNKEIIETRQGTLITVFYNGPLAYYGLVFRSTDMGLKWTLVANITAIKTPEGRCLAARHVHFLWYDKETNIIYVIGGERDTNLPPCLDRVTILSEDDGKTWKFFGRPYNDGPVIFVKNIAIYGGHGSTFLTVIQHNYTYDSVKILGYLFVPDQSGWNEAVYDYKNHVLYMGEYDESIRGDLYAEEYAWFIEPPGKFFFYPVQVFKIEVPGYWYSDTLVLFKDYVVNILWNGQTPEYIVIHRRLTSSEVLFYATRQLINSEYISSGNYTITLDTFVDTLLLKFTKYELFNRSVRPYLLSYDTFENGKTDGWYLYNPTYGQVTIVDVGYHSHRSLNFTTTTSSDSVCKDIVLHEPLPPGTVIVVAGYVKQVKGNVNVYYDKYGITSVWAPGSVVAYYTDGSYETVDYIYASKDFQTVGWVPIITRVVKPLSKPTYKIRVCISMGPHASLLIDDVAVYALNVSTIPRSSNNIIYTYGIDILPTGLPLEEDNFTIYINGTPYSVADGVVAIPFHRYVRSIVLSVPPNVGVMRMSIEVTGVSANVPLLYANGTYYYPYGFETNNFTVMYSPIPVVVPVSNNVTITSIQVKGKVMYIRIEAHNVDSALIAIYTSLLGRPNAVYVNGFKIPEVYSKAALETVSYGWYYDKSRRILYIKLRVSKIALISVSWKYTSTIVLPRTLHYELTYMINMTHLDTHVTYVENVSTLRIFANRSVLQVYAKPYVNNTSYVGVNTNATIIGTWLSGTVSDLLYKDNVWMLFKTYNSSNTMIFVSTFNVTTLGWLASDPTLDILDIIVRIAGNCSKYVNTRASLEILNWTSGKWVTIDPAALNQTTDTEKVYHLAQVLGGDLRDLIGPGGIIAFRINVTDVQSYPSTYVNVAIDELTVEVVYRNETSGTAVATITIPFLPNSTTYVDNVSLSLMVNGSGELKQVSMWVLDENGTVVDYVPNITLSKTWTTYTVQVGKYLGKNCTIRLMVRLVSGLDSGVEVYVRDVRVHVHGTADLSTLLTCYRTVLDVHDVALRKVRAVQCMLAIPLTRGLDYAVESMIRLELPKYFKIVSALHGAHVVPVRVLETLQDMKSIEVINASGDAYTYIYMNDTVHERLDKYGTMIMTFVLPEGSAIPLAFDAPSGEMFIMFSNGTVITVRPGETIFVKSSGLPIIARVYYGKYFNRTFYLWLNLTNPTVKLLGATYDVARHVLTVHVDAEGLVELNVRTDRVPTGVTLVYANATYTAEEVPDLSSYRACRPPCWYYDPATGILRIKAMTHSPLTFNVQFGAAVQGVKVVSISLTMPTHAEVDKPIKATIGVTLHSSTETSTRISIDLTCSGPTTIEKTLTETVHVVQGTQTLTFTTYVAFPRVGTYACVATVGTLQSNVAYVNVVRPTTPTHVKYTTPLLLLLLLAIIVIVGLCVYVMEKKRSSIVIVRIRV